MLDCPVEFIEEDFELSKPDFQKVSDVFQELEFRRMHENFNRIFRQSETSSDNKTESVTPIIKSDKSNSETQQLDLFATSSNVLGEVITGFREAKNTDHFYQYINTALSRKLLIDKLLRQKSVCFDTETTSLNTMEAELVGIAFAYEKVKDIMLLFLKTEKRQNLFYNLFNRSLRAKKLKRSARI